MSDDLRLTTVTITNLATSVRVGAKTILDAALEAGLPFPHGCRAGDCGTCVAKLLEGSVDSVQGLGAGFDEWEEDERLILACSVVPRTDVTIEWLGADDACVPSVQKREGFIRSLDCLGGDVMRLRIEPTSSMHFLPGQYAELSFPGRPSRSFSMANPPGDRSLEFHIRHYPDGVVSDYVAREVAVGDRVGLKGPYGSAFLRRDDRPILAVAGGVGFAPIRAIVVSALRGSARSPVHLYFGARDEDHLYLLEELEELERRHPRLRLEPVLSEPDGPTERRTGLVHTAVEADIGLLHGVRAYIAGPPPMVEATGVVLKRHGIPPARIHQDPFLPHHERLARKGGASGLVARLGRLLGSR